jgi:pimeloyl-ACP methyl ester carboxylesterase
VQFATGLRGWVAPSHNGAAIVFVHGSPANRAELWPQANGLVEAGYGAVLFDLPGCGESAGAVDWGAPSQRAIRHAVQFAREQPGVRHVGALGFSVGSAILGVVAPREPSIEAVVLEGTFPSAKAELDSEFSRWGPLTQWPAEIAAWQSGLDFSALRPVDGIAQLSPRPLLVIAGELDATVPPKMARALFDAAREPKELWIVPGAHHGDYLEATSGAAESRLRAFFDAALLKP